MRKSGRTDSWVIGLLVNATVATGAKPKNIRILLASSGSVENAMNAGKEDGEEPHQSGDSRARRPVQATNVSKNSRAASVTDGGSLRVSDVEDLLLARHLQDVVDGSWEVPQSHLIITADTQHLRPSKTR